MDKRATVASVFLASSAGAAPSDNSNSVNAEVQKAIDDGNAHYIAAYAHKDPEAFAAVYDTDAVRLDVKGNRSATRGRNAIARGVKRFMKGVSGSVQVTAVTQRLYVVGSMAFEEGKYTLDFTLTKAKERHHLAGQYVTIWKRQRDGDWKILVDMPVPAT
jgi:uncharacterized protein (TIGR02246 family)